MRSIVPAKGGRSDPSNRTPVAHFPVPRNSMEGLRSYYHRVACRFVRTTEPLGWLLAMAPQFTWGTELPPKIFCFRLWHNVEKPAARFTGCISGGCRFPKSREGQGSLAIYLLGEDCADTRRVQPAVHWGARVCQCAFFRKRPTRNSVFLFGYRGHLVCTPKVYALLPPAKVVECRR